MKAGWGQVHCSVLKQVSCILPQLNPLLLWVCVAWRQSAVVTHHVGHSRKLSTVQLPEPPVNATRVHPIDCRSILFVHHRMSVAPKSVPVMAMRVHHRLTACQWGHQYRQRYASVVLPHTSEPPLNFVLWIPAIALLKNQRGLDSGSDSEDLIIGDTEPGTVGPSGLLPSPECMSGVHQELEHWSGLSLVTESEPVHVSACPEIMPHTCDSILGDGNCLFRALSKEVTGTQENHKAVCVAIVNFMEHPNNAQVYFLERRLKKCVSLGCGGHLGKSVRLLHSSKMISSFLHTLVRKSADGSVFHLSFVIIRVHCLQMESNFTYTTPSLETITTEWSPS